MSYVYEYYIWDPNGEDDKLSERITEALESAGLECEFNRLEEE